jgi:hypothetical protein
VRIYEILALKFLRCENLRNSRSPEIFKAAAALHPTRHPYSIG